MPDIEKLIEKTIERLGATMHMSGAEWNDILREFAAEVVKNHQNKRGWDVDHLLRTRNEDNDPLPDPTLLPPNPSQREIDNA